MSKGAGWNRVSKEPVRVKDALSQVGKRLGIRAPAEAALVFSRWDQIVGRKIADHVRPTSLRGGVLRICADSSVWATEVSYLHEEIKRQANEVAGTRVISEVKVWTGKAPEEPLQAPEKAPPPAFVSASRPASKQSSTDDPDEALSRARKAWSRARARTRSQASENPESPR